MPEFDTGTGLTVEFETSGFSARILEMSWGGISRSFQDLASLRDEDYSTRRPDDVSDAGAVTLRVQFDPDQSPPVTAAAETVALLFDEDGSDVRAWSGSAFLTDFQFEAPLDDLMTASITFKFSGAISAARQRTPVTNDDGTTVTNDVSATVYAEV